MDSVIEREEWLILLTMLGDIRPELENLNDFLKGGGDEEAEADP